LGDAAVIAGLLTRSSERAGRPAHSDSNPCMKTQMTTKIHITHTEATMIHQIKSQKLRVDASTRAPSR
jgi:hypothetical protein